MNRGRTLVACLAILGVAAFLGRRMLLMSAPRCLRGHWHGCYDTENGLMLMLVVLLPVAAVLVQALTRLRRVDQRLPLAEVGMVYGTVPFVYLTLMPGPGAGIVPGRLSLVPFQDLISMGALGFAGNLLVFAALGFFAPMRFAALASVPRILALGAGCSILIETGQYAFQLDRVTSVDDVLVNAAGAVLAGLASRRWWRTAAEAPRATTPARRPALWHGRSEP